MKPLKYACFFLFLCCSLAMMEIPSHAAEVYTLDVVFLGVNENEDGVEMTVQLLSDGREVEIGVAEDCRFLDLTRNEETSFAVFIERYMARRIEIDFVSYEDDYLIVECRGFVPSLM